MRRLALVMILAGCDAPYVEIASPPDTAVADANPDAYVFPDASKTLPDGAVCSGHDEDRDGWPDVCDVCPGIHDTQDIGDQEIGTACEVGGPASVGTFHRVFFDPLVTFAMDSWLSGGKSAFTVLPESPDAFTGGLAAPSMGLAVVTQTFDTKTPLVVTAAIVGVGNIDNNRTGVFLRGSSGGDAFIGCGVRGAGRLGIVVATGCYSDCTPTLLGVESDPFVTTRQQQAIRMVARERADGGADIDCWLFDTANPIELQGSPKVTATVDAAQWGTGRPRVGLFAKNTRASASWFEVLSGTM